MRLLVAVVLTVVLWTCAMRLAVASRRRGDRRREAWLRWFVHDRRTAAGLLMLFGGLLVVSVAIAVPGEGWRRLNQAASQLNLLLLTLCVCLFWPAVGARRLRQRRVSRWSLALNLLILSVVVQGPLHAARMYQLDGGQLVTWQLAGRVLAFVAISCTGSFFAWFLTEDVSAAATSGLADPPLERDPNAIGIALSGGGIRAAVVATGLLRFMRPSAWWQRVSHLSAVSGGSWALANLLRAEHEPSPGQPAKKPREVARMAVSLLRRNRDYIRGGKGSGWLARPVVVGAVAMSLQLASLLLSALLLVAFGLYLDQLSDSKVSAGTHIPLKALRELGHDYPFAPHTHQSLERLDTLLGCGYGVLWCAAFVIAFALCLVAVSRTRLTPRHVAERLEQLAASAAWAGFIAAALALVPMLLVFRRRSWSGWGCSPR